MRKKKKKTKKKKKNKETKNKEEKRGRISRKKFVLFCNGRLINRVYTPWRETPHKSKRQQGEKKLRLFFRAMF